MKKKAQLSTVKRAILGLALVVVILSVIIPPINNLFASVFDLFGNGEGSEEEKEIEPEETKYITDIICGRQELGGSCALKGCIELDRRYVAPSTNPCPTVKDKAYYCCGEKVEYCEKNKGRCVRTEERCGPIEEPAPGYYCETYKVLCCIKSEDPNLPVISSISFDKNSYEIGQTSIITWTATDKETAKEDIQIEIYLSYPTGGAILLTDTPTVPNTGSYEWIVTEGETGPNFQISIHAIDQRGNRAIAESSDTFEIKPQSAEENT